MGSKECNKGCDKCECSTDSHTKRDEAAQKILDMIENLKDAETSARSLSSIAGGVGGILKQVSDNKTPDARKPFLVKELGGLVKEAGLLAVNVKTLKNFPSDQIPYARKLFDAAIPKVAAELERVPNLSLDDHTQVKEASAMINEAQAALSAIVDQVSDSRISLKKELDRLDVARENLIASQVTVRDLDKFLESNQQHTNNQWLKQSHESKIVSLSVKTL